MKRIIAILVLASLSISGIASAEECTTKLYEGLVIEAKNADANRMWDGSEKLYRRMLDDCRGSMAEGDLAKLYDALAVALLMQQRYGEAIDAAKSCLEQDSRYNACMMTAASAYQSLGDQGMAAQMARDAIEVGSYDEYSAATVIYAKEFLRRIEGRNK